MSLSVEDRIRGSLVGGAIGDALGYPVEFMNEDQIFSRYGPCGITEYELDPESHKAIISDDTQMTLFTANGLLCGFARNRKTGGNRPLRSYIETAYMEWLETQEKTYEESWEKHHMCWITERPELYYRRAPGDTCLGGIRSRRDDPSKTDDYISDPRTDRKGCGGIMRVAPIGLCTYFSSIEEADMEGAQAAAITHGNSLAYMPAALLVHIVNRATYTDGKMSLREIVEDGEKTIRKLFKEDKQLDEFIRQIDLALELTENDKPDLDNIHVLGEGWLGDEACAISVYCAVKYEHDFAKGVITAVNHNGDSDSTGAIVGNILGAVNGYDAIKASWKKNLELKEVLFEITDDLCYGPDSDFILSDFMWKYWRVSYIRE